MKERMLEICFRDYDGYKMVQDCVLQYIKQVLRCPNPSIEVALNEAVNNALCHGAGKRVIIKLGIIGGKRLVIRVKDKGGGFAAGKYLESEEEDLFSESGRGIYLMKMLTDCLRYNKKGDEVLLMKRISVQGQEEAFG